MVADPVIEAMMKQEDAKCLADIAKATDVVKYLGATVRFTCPECKHVFLPNAKERQSRVGASSRRKGANFERLTAKKLQKWWGNGSVWKRTPMSGGSALKDGFDMAGDLCCNAKDMGWHFELKNAPTQFAGIHQILSAPNCAIWGWLDQAIKDCPSHRSPMLILNRFDQPTLCVVPTINGANKAYLIFSNLKMGYLVSHYTKWELAVFLFDDMIKSDPKYWV